MFSLDMTIYFLIHACMSYINFAYVYKTGVDEIPLIDGICF